MTTGLCCCCCYRRRIAPVHCSPAHRLRVYRDRYSIPSISLRALSPLFNKDALHDNALVAVERAIVDSRVLIFPKKLDGDFRIIVILSFAILQFIVTCMFGFLRITRLFSLLILLIMLKKIFVKIKSFTRHYIFHNLNELKFIIRLWKIQE